MTVFVSKPCPQQASPPVLSTAAAMGAPVLVRAHALDESLTRRQVNGQLDLFGDVDVLMFPGPNATESDTAVATVRLSTHGVQRDLRWSRINSATLRIYDFPVRPPSAIELEMTSGSVIRTPWPGLVMSPSVGGDMPVASQLEETAWPNLLEAIGISDNHDRPPSQLRRAQEWQFSLRNGYATLVDGMPSPEDDSPFQERLMEVLADENEEELLELFGTTEPFTVMWTFEGANLTTHTAVPVVVGSSSAVNQIAREITSRSASSETVRVRFPDQPADQIYRLTATAIVKDSLGETAAVQHVVYSHFLYDENQARLADAISSYLVSLQGDDTNAFMTTADLTPLPPDDPRIEDRLYTRARVTRISAIRAARDQLLNLPEIQTVLASAQQYVALKFGPTITDPPHDVSVGPGATASFSVSASGPGQLTYQWRFKGADLPGATNPTLTIANVQLSHDGEYEVLVGNQFGVTSSGPARLAVLVDPVIVVPPLSQAVVEGGNVTFSVGITGNPPPFTYAWRKLDAPQISRVSEDSATQSYFTLTGVQAIHHGSYLVSVSNAANPNSVSRPFFLTVLTDGDRDGMPDRWEEDHGLQPNNPADAATDRDGDGVVNLDEYIAGTDPQNPSSYLRVEIQNASLALIRFAAVSTKTYTVEYTDSLNQPMWLKLADVMARPNDRIEYVSDPAPAPNRVYRLATPRQP